LTSGLVHDFQFQSAPRARARGDPVEVPLPAGVTLFQSAPRARARGDQRGPASSHRFRSFNPRPALARGATQ